MKFLVGLSGGLDSSYMLHLAVNEWGLRPFVFHIDCGWDLPETVENLKKMEINALFYIGKMI